MLTPNSPCPTAPRLPRPSAPRPRRRAGTFGRPALLLAALLCLLCLRAEAGSFRRLSLEEMTSVSDEVLLGRVVQVQSRWTDDASQILTYVTLEHVRALKGQAEERVTLVQLGGTVGDWCLSVSGAPSWRPGEEVLCFVLRMQAEKRHPLASDRWLLGLGQGVWRIRRDARSGAASARIALEGQELVQLPGRALESELALTELERRVSQAVVDQAAAAREQEGK